MGKPTGQFSRVIKRLGHGSDYYGNCEICGKHVSETFVSWNKREWIRSNGEIYYGNECPGVYGHEKCIAEKFKQAA